MDYINFGIGTGATLALFGWLFRDWGPRFRDRPPIDDEILSARELVSRMAWKRFCRSCGMAMTIGGMLVVFATAMIAFWNPHDELGFRIILGLYGVVLLLLLVWAGLFLRQFGSIGIIRPREKTSLSTVPTKTAVTGEPVAVSATATDAPSTDEAPDKDKSFDEVAAGRGGLGRFAAFFRRDASAPTEDPAPSMDLGPVVSQPETTESVELSPTDAVILELGTPEAEDDAEKRLSTTDPLVVQVMGRIDSDRAIAASDEGGLERELEGENALPADTPDDVVEPAVVEPATPEDEALANLRKRRLARLSGDSD